MDALSTGALEWAVADRPRDRGSPNGDGAIVVPTPSGALLAIVDGAGHGADAADSMRATLAVIERHADEPLEAIVRDCDALLRDRRGAAIALVAVDAQRDTLDWLAIGDVAGLVWREGRRGPRLIARRGTVGRRVGPIAPARVALRPGDLVVLTTDGVRGGPEPDGHALESPGALADRLLAARATADDDALVLVARYRGSRGAAHADDFAARCRAALALHLERPDERTLHAAYALGREALDGSLGVLDIADALLEALGHAMFARDPAAAPGPLEPFASFALECLSPFEMAHRGAREANLVLRRMSDRREEDLRRIAHELHDSAGQMLVALKLSLDDARAAIGPTADAPLARAQERLREAERELRRLAHELRPTILDDLGLVPALRSLADGVRRRHGLAVDVRGALVGRLPRAVETALYRIAQEALTNAVRHAGASRVTVELAGGEGAVACRIADDGVGFDLERLERAGLAAGIGLAGMRQRVAALAGTLALDATPGRGTVLDIRIPIEVAACRA